MLTSPRTSGNNNFVPGHHLALITQPVLGARSRKRSTKNVLIETMPMNERVDMSTTSRRSSYNDSPPLLFPNNRVDLAQYHKKNSLNSHHESSDSGLDLSLSTNSSVQLQLQQQHLPTHRPLSALNEDSSPDDGYHDAHPQQTQGATIRLRLPPVHLGRNRSMEDMLSNREQQQKHRSSSFSDDQQQQQQMLQQQQKKIKRSSDGALLDLLDTDGESTELRRRADKIRSETFTIPTQQLRHLNDLTNKTSHKVTPIRNETNMSTALNAFTPTHTVARKPNTSTLKPLRKKTKLHLLVEPPAMSSSRLALYDEPVRTMTNTNSSSSTQTTPRANRASLQYPQNKQKALTPLGHYPNQEQIRAHVNRSVIERQQPPPLPPRRGIIQQLIPFDASPAKINNLLRHHVQQQQPTTLYHQNPNVLLTQPRQVKQCLPALYAEETMANGQDGRRMQREQIKDRESDGRRKLKHREEIEPNRWQESEPKGPIKAKILQESVKVKDGREPIESKQYLSSVQRRYDKREEEEDEEMEQFLTSTPRHRYEHDEGNNRQSNESFANGRDSSNGNQRQPRPVIVGEVTRRQRFQDPTHGGSKPAAGVVLRNKTQATIGDRNFHPLGNEHGLPSRNVVSLQFRPSKVSFQTFETPTKVLRSPMIEQNHHANQWESSKHINEHPTWKKSQRGPVNNTPRAVRVRPMLPKYTTEFHEPPQQQQQREVSQLSNSSQRFDEVQQNKTTGKQPAFDSTSPTSWSITSEPQQFENNDDISPCYSSSPRSPSPLEELIVDHSNVPPLTYRLTMPDEHQHTSDHTLKTPTFADPSSHTSSRHTYPFNCTPDFDDVVAGDSSQQISGEIRASGYVSPPRNSIQNASDRRNLPSPLVRLSAQTKFDIPLEKISVMETRTGEEDETTTNYDSDDGWSDDSAELLYVDERYATQKKKNNTSSHLVQQQQQEQQHHHHHHHHHHYQTSQQQNVLLQ